MSQALHCLVVAFRAQVALGAVFDSDVSQSGRHDGEGDGRGPAPVPKDAVGGVIFGTVERIFFSFG